MSTRHKLTKCTNCDHVLLRSENFCPNCGQKNTDLKYTTLTLLREFYENYLSFDSRFGKSIIPFLFKPGHLTTAFHQGKRLLYINPVRLFLICNLLYFTLLSFFVFKEDTNEKQAEKIITKKRLHQVVDTFLVNKVVYAIKNKEDKSTLQLEDELWPLAIITAPDEYQLIDSLLLEESQKEILKSIIDTDFEVGASNVNIGNGMIQINSDYENDKNKNPKIKKSKIQTVEDLDKENQLSKYSEVYERITYREYYTSDLLYDSLSVIEASWFQKRVFMHLTEIANFKVDYIEIISKSFSITAFLMVPIFGFILYIYFRKKRAFYIDHLVHGIHLISFAFIIGSLLLLLDYFINDYLNPSTSIDFVGIIFFILISIYTSFSFRKVYKIPWGKAVGSMFLNGFLFVFTTSFVAVLWMGLYFLVI